MKRNTITLQFIENGLIILHKQKLIKYKLKSVNNYTIINKENFINEINKIIQINKINNDFLTDNINIIIDNSYTNLYLLNLKEIFKDLSFNKIEFINIEDIIKLKDNEILVDISTSNIKILYHNHTIDNKIYYSKHKQILIMHIKKIKKNHNIEYIYLYGDYHYTPKFIEDLETSCNIKVYIYTKPELIPIKLLI